MSVVSVGEVAEFLRGITFKPTDLVSPDESDSVVCMRTKNIQDDLDSSDIIAVPARFVRRDELFLRPGDLLISSANSWELVGKTVMVGNLPYRATAGGFIAIIRAKASHVNPRFLFHWMRDPRTQNAIRNCGRQTTNISNLSVDQFLALQLSIPSLQDQQNVAATLDKADAICKKRRKALKFADEFLRSVFLDMFGDPITNSKGWDDLPIKEVAIVTTGNTPSRQVLDYFGDHIEWIKSDNINTSNHHLTKATEGLSQIGLGIGRSAPAGSTLVTCIAGSPACIGNAALSDRRVAFNQQINALTPKPGIEPEFLYAVTLFSKVRIQAASTNGMKGMVSKGALEQVKFILPPKPERLAFVRIFEKVLATLRKMQVASDEADHLFESLQQQAFS